MSQIVMDDATVLNLLRNPEAKRTFPFLATSEKRLTDAVKSGTGCGGCRKKRLAAGTEIESIKRSIATMPKSEQNKLKQLLGATSISLKYRLSARKAMKVKF